MDFSSPEEQQAVAFGGDEAELATLLLDGRFFVLVVSTQQTRRSMHHVCTLISHCLLCMDTFFFSANILFLDERLSRD